MAAFCAQRTRIATVLRHARRPFTSVADGSESRLLSQDDWTAFQVHRAERSTLVDLFSNFGSTQSRDNTWQPHHPLHRPTASRDLTLSALLAAGAHLGHHSSLLNPNFIPYAYGTRAGITVIDLDRTLPHLRRAASLVRAVASRDGTIVFVGTRSDLRPTVLKAAQRIGSQGYHIAEKWLPGTLTNKVHFFGPEVTLSERVVPDLVIFLNPIPNLHAIRECAIEHVPTIGIVDSNVDPRIVMYPIPANDESTRTAELIAGVLSIAGREGVEIAAERAQKRARSARSMAKHRTLKVD
ncbi:ribosomal protein S2, flavodoxin-like domain-containing protein [Multifurca ochricompacta]|uniref:Ribosomal protein S2, flavodoxin-like domain-containing protein n=1 Tax=Multifurca ochricompacta TaxID=376703 RepID=A0AAD4M5V4_9AGAM|nr:ribosomal protein S2, flavodoxin-like domain-containing protein [Multifurca ochricompacta]